MSLTMKHRSPADVKWRGPAEFVLSLNDLIRPLEERLRDRQAEGLGGLEVDHQLELRRLLDGQVGGLGALEDLIDIRGGTSEQVSKVRPIGHQPTVFPRGPLAAPRWQPVLLGEADNQLPQLNVSGTLGNHQGISTGAAQSRQGPVEVVGRSHILGEERQPEDASWSLGRTLTT